MLHHLHKLFKKYWSGEWSYIVPRNFKQQVELIHSQFAGNGQVGGSALLNCLQLRTSISIS